MTCCQTIKTDGLGNNLKITVRTMLIYYKTIKITPIMGLINQNMASLIKNEVKGHQAADSFGVQERKNEEKTIKRRETIKKKAIKPNCLLVSVHNLPEAKSKQEIFRVLKSH